jgi:hypothetical protein
MKEVGLEGLDIEVPEIAAKAKRPRRKAAAKKPKRKSRK